MENPHDYNDDELVRYSSETDSAIGGLWEAGATLDDIEDTVSSALKNATGTAVVVSLVAVGPLA